MPNVLIVDDDHATLEILRANLRAEGHTVLEAAEGLGVREPLPRVDVAALDWMLPGVSSADGGRRRAAACRRLQRLPDRPAGQCPVLKPAVQVRDARLFRLPSCRMAR